MIFKNWAERLKLYSTVDWDVRLWTHTVWFMQISGVSLICTSDEEHLQLVVIWQQSRNENKRHVKATHATQIIYWIWNCVTSTMKILVPRWANMKIQALHYKCLSEMSNRYLVLYTTEQITEKSLEESI